MILIISPDPDFCEVLTEQLSCELGVSCVHAPNEAEAKKLPQDGVSMVVTTETLTTKWPVAVKEAKRADAPLKLKDLLADIRALLQKAGTPSELVFGGGFKLLLRKKQLVASSGKTADVTDKEIALLQSLLAAKKPVAKETLLKDIWGFDADMNTHTLETHIYRLREKFRELGGEQVIAAVNGGYALDMA